MRSNLFTELMTVLLSGNALVLTNEVTLRPARLVLGWVYRLVNHLGILPTTQVNLAWPSLRGKGDKYQRKLGADMHTTRRTSPVRMS